MDERMAELVRMLKESRWSTLAIDREFNLVWISDSLKEFMEEPDDRKIGVGQHVLNAMTSEVWLRSATPESAMQMFTDVAPFLVELYRRRGEELPPIPEPFRDLMIEIEPRPLQDAVLTGFEYVSSTPEIPNRPVKMLFVQIKDDDGDFAGVILFCFIDISPNLVSLLARGEESMYERMAKLVDPGTRQAAVLFCDLAGSGRLSRQLSSATYFRLVRQLWTGIDQTVADNDGIIGKHAGDGASAYFLVDDLGSPSKAAHAAVASARRIHELSAQTFAEVMDGPCVMRIGIHWGGSLYMGQLVPGGRLDVTALGDEVIECARIQESAEENTTLASKQLLEQLTDDDAASLGIDLEKLHYAPLADLSGANEKAARDAGGVAVTTI